MTDPHPALRRAREEIEAARLLAGSNYAAAAVSRSYYAASYAAEVALLSLGETRSKHSGVVSAIGQIAVRRHGLDPRAGRLLRSLFDRRSQADYDVSDVPSGEAQLAVTDAEEAVGLVEAWLSGTANGTAAP